MPRTAVRAAVDVDFLLRTVLVVLANGGQPLFLHHAPGGGRGVVLNRAGLGAINHRVDPLLSAAVAVRRFAGG